MNKGIYQYSTRKDGIYPAIFLAILLIITGISLQAAGKQVQLNNGMWQAVGFQGGYTVDGGSVSYAADGAFEVKDVADDNTTWVSYDINETDVRYNGLNGRTNIYGLTQKIGGTIGIFAIKGKKSKTGKTTLDGGDENVVYMKFKDAKTYRGDIPQYRMYIEGSSGIPTIRVDYQGNHNGDKFRLKFGTEKDAYISYFSYENTYDNPAKLINDKDVTTGAKKGIPKPLIKDTIDFNLTDNNVTKLYNDGEQKFRIHTREGKINAEDFRVYSANSDNRIEAYEMVNGVYNRFDTKNTQKDSNQFDKFTPGRGYWIRVSSKEAHADYNYTQIGLITKDSNNIHEDNLYGNIENGWHMLSFGDMDLRYSPTGIFIPLSVLGSVPAGHVLLRGGGVEPAQNSGLRIHFDRHAIFKNTNELNITTKGSYRGDFVDTGRIIEVNETRGIQIADHNLTAPMHAKKINIASQASKLLYGTNTNVRAFPAVAPATATNVNGVEGIIVISDQLFEINNTFNGAITTLTGKPLRGTTRGMFSSVYGEFVLAADIFNLNDFGFTVETNGTFERNSSGDIDYNGTSNAITGLKPVMEINATLEINMPGYSAKGAVVSDLQDGNRSKILTKLKDGLEKAATRTGKTTAQTSVNAYFIDIAMKYPTYVVNSDNLPVSINSFGDLLTKELLESNGTTFIDGNQTRSILLTAGSRFSITDKTKVRVYQFIANGKFKIISGKTEQLVDTKNYNSMDIKTTVDAINNVADKTDLKAFAIGKTVKDSKSKEYFMIVSHTGKAYLEEDYNYTLFKDIPLNSKDIPKDNRTITKGLIGSVYSHKQLLDMKLNLNTDLLTNEGNVSFLLATGFIDGNESNWSDGNVRYNYMVDQRYDFNTTDNNGTPKDVSKAANLSQDLQDNAIWALDFPVAGSLISKFTKYRKEISSMMVQKFTNDNQYYYDFLDLSKDPSQWYGNKYDTDDKKKFNDDYQGIFRIFANQNYWLQLKDKDPLPSTDLMMKLPESKIVYIARASFDNNLTKGIGVVQNHISHTLKIQFKEQFIDPLNKDFYNVAAIIDGKKYYLRNDGKYFTLKIDDLDMGLQERNSTQANIPIFIQAYDGLGNVLKEDSTKDKSQFSILFNKPPTPQLRWSKDGSLEITNKGIFTAEVYLTGISDIADNREKEKIVFNNAKDITDNEKLSWKGEGNKKLKADYGKVIPLRVVLKNKDYELYSNIQGILYAPLTSGHVLEVTAQKTRATVPYSYLQKQFLTAIEPGKKSSEAPKYNGKLGVRNVTANDKSGNGVDNGIQIDRLKAGTGSNNVMFYYYPEGAESQKRLPSFGGTRTAYISVKSDTTTDKKAIIAITYIPDYEGKIFYMFFNSKLYQGVFPNNDAFNSDATSYDISQQGKLKVENVVSTAQGKQVAIGTAGGYEIEMLTSNVQPIVIPQGGSTAEPTPKPTPDNGGNNNSGSGLP